MQMAEANAPSFHPDFECIINALPGGEKVHAGLDGLRAGLLDSIAPWATYRVGIAESRDLGDRVLLPIADFGRLQVGGQEVEQSGAAVYTGRDGQITRIESYDTCAEALKAVGGGNVGERLTYHRSAGAG